MSTVENTIASPVSDSLEKFRIFALCSMLVAVLIAFREPVLTMMHLWRTSDTYAHGALIPFISAYLVYQLRARLDAAGKEIYWPALPLLAFCGAVWAAAALADVAVVQQLAVIAVIQGIILLFMGARWVKTALFPLGFLFLAVPMGNALTPHLVDMTADFVVVALRWSGIPVYREGTFFVIPSGNWSVVSGCSGMRYLIATITVGILFAYLNYRSLWRRVTFVGIAILVAVIGNWLRAYGIVMIAHLSGMKLALGIDHYIYGWVFFGILIFITMTVGMIWSEPPSSIPATALRANSEGTKRSALFGAVAWTMLCVLVWPLLVYQLSQARPQPTPDISIAAEELGSGCSRSESPAPDWIPHYVGGPVQSQASYVCGTQEIGWHTAWYGAQSQGAEVVNAANQLVHEKHDPWRLRASGVFLKGPDVMPEVNESILKQRNGERELLVWQWYWVGGHATVRSLLAKLYGALSILRGAGNPAASALVYTPIAADEKMSSARARLAKALTPLAPKLNDAFDAAVKR